MNVLKYIFLCFCIFVFVCACKNNYKEYSSIKKNHIGLNKQQTWVSLIQLSKNTKAKLRGKRVSKRINTIPVIYIDNNTGETIPEVFLLASEWVWSSPDTKYYYIFVFDEQNVVSKIRRDKSWK